MRGVAVGLLGREARMHGRGRRFGVGRGLAAGALGFGSGHQRRGELLVKGEKEFHALTFARERLKELDATNQSRIIPGRSGIVMSQPSCRVRA